MTFLWPLVSTAGAPVAVIADMWFSSRERFVRFTTRADAKRVGSEAVLDVGVQAAQVAVGLTFERTLSPDQFSADVELEELRRSGDLLSGERQGQGQKEGERSRDHRRMLNQASSRSVRRNAERI